MKRFTSRLLAAVSLLCLLGGSAAAQENDQRAYVLMNQGEAGVTLSTPEEPAFWEYPQIPAGQRRVGGILRLVNNGDKAANMVLSEISLPYGNDEVLAYLGHLNITVAERERATASAEEIAAPLTTTTTKSTATTAPTGDGAAGEETAAEDTAAEESATEAAPTEETQAPPPETTVPTATADEGPITEKLLYDGPYSRIADADGLKIEIKDMQPGEVREYVITLQCDFTYEGDVSMVATPVPWEFSATSSYLVTPPRPSLWENPLVAVLLCGAGALIVVIVVVVVVRAILAKKRRNGEPPAGSHGK